MKNIFYRWNTPKIGRPEAENKYPFGVANPENLSQAVHPNKTPARANQGSGFKPPHA